MIENVGTDEYLKNENFIVCTAVLDNPSLYQQIMNKSNPSFYCLDVSYFQIE